MSINAVKSPGDHEAERERNRNMKIIDLNTWERSTHYQFFRRMDYPHYNLCVNIDITHFLQAIQEKRLPFYYAMIYAASTSVNQVDAFRYRIRGEQVVLHDAIHLSFTDMFDNTDLFKMITVDMEDSIEAFAFKAEEKLIKQKDYFIAKEIEGRDDLVHISCIP